MTGVIDRLYGKLWTLRFLKKSGMSQSNLLKIYEQVLRPSAEYSHVVYHSLIPEYVAEKLECVQRQAMKIVFGYDVDYNQLIQDGKISSLKSRRESALSKFALKASVSPRFSSALFEPVPASERSVRKSTRNLYVEKKFRTQRGRNNPVAVMTRRLNEIYKGN